jgi:hypothetical protein
MTIQLNQEILDLPIEGVNLSGKTFGEQLGKRATLLVFLRHFGCIFCRESVKDLQAISEKDPSYPNVLLVYQGSRQAGEEFFGKFWEAARAVADRPKRLYNAFGLRHGTLTQLLGPSVWVRGVEAMAKGNFIGKPVGDPLVLPGYFLIYDQQVIWEYRSKHSADHPDFHQLKSHLPAVL